MSCPREVRYVVQAPQLVRVGTIARPSGLQVRALPGMLISTYDKTSALLDRMETLRGILFQRRV